MMLMASMRPLDCEFLHRESEISETYNSVNDNKVTILTGPSGIGKTRLALEVCRKKGRGRGKSLLYQKQWKSVI